MHESDKKERERAAEPRRGAGASSFLFPPFSFFYQSGYRLRVIELLSLSFLVLFLALSLSLVCVCGSEGTSIRVGR